MPRLPMTKTQLDLMMASGYQGEGCTHDTHEGRKPEWH